MHAHHNHEHEHHSYRGGEGHGNERTVLLGFLLTFSFMIVEAVGGYLSGSLALLADAGHMLTDAVALGLAWGAFRIGRRLADHKRTYGYMRFEVIAGFINALTLIGIVFWIGMEAYERFHNPSEILTGTMLIVAIIGLLVNLLVFKVLSHGDHDHVNIRGAILHVLGDMLGSIGAITAAIVIYFTGWTPIDPLLSIFVALLILRSAWALLRNSLHILLEGAPDNAQPEEIEKILMEHVGGLHSVHHIHVWSITSGKILATMEIRPELGANLPVLVEHVKEVLHEHFQIDHATVAIDWAESDRKYCLFA